MLGRVGGWVDFQYVILRSKTCNLEVVSALQWSVHACSKTMIANGWTHVFHPKGQIRLFLDTTKLVVVKGFSEPGLFIGGSRGLPWSFRPVLQDYPNWVAWGHSYGD